MSDPPDGTRRRRLFLVLPRDDDGTTILTSDGALPSVEVDGNAGEPALPLVLDEVARRFRFRPVPLRLVALAVEGDDHGATFLLELEASRVDGGVDARWRGLETLLDGHLEPAAARRPLERWLAERRSEPTANRPAWSRAGWFAAAAAWMAERLTAAGTPLTGAAPVSRPRNVCHADP